MDIQEFDYAVDIMQAILWQYNNATTIISLTDQKQTWYDSNQTEFWQDWFTNVFNLQTANQFGLAVWAFILNLPIYINTGTEPPDYAFAIGFNDYTTYPALINTYQNFNGVGTLPITGTGANFDDQGTQYILTIAEQRFVLQLRYFQFCNRGDVYDINSFLNYLYLQNQSKPEQFGPIWVLDGLNMTMRYVFSFPISTTLLDVLQQNDLLPRPAAVALQYYNTADIAWGFDTSPAVSGNQNFYNSNFIPDSFFGFGA